MSTSQPQVPLQIRSPAAPAFVATDLHGHTHFSDGTAAPEALVAARHAAGVRVTAITDHDQFTAVERGAQAAAARGMLLVPAMEATSFVGFGTREAEQFHVLAYFPCEFLRRGRLEQTALYRRGVLVRERWRAFVLNWLDLIHPEDRDALDPHGELAAHPAEVFPGLQQIIDRIVVRHPAIFRHFIRSHVHFWTDDRELFGWTPEDLIDTIRADGGIDVVAHPARYRDKERLARVLLGASGVEVYTSRHRPEWAARFRSFAEQYGKLWTASTDDHQKGPYAPPPHGTPLHVVAQLTGLPSESLEPLAGLEPLPAAEARA